MYRSPFSRYIPSRALMFKLMRACIGITNIEDIWYLKLEKKITIEKCASKKRNKMKNKKSQFNLQKQKFSSKSLNQKMIEDLLKNIEKDIVVRGNIEDIINEEN